ncbi:MAG: hypothetical protein HY020_16485 [Burkholderiales bacterium]|nr:hypothetical protein [Burkholderiales bacterium]
MKNPDDITKEWFDVESVHVQVSDQFEKALGWDIGSSFSDEEFVRLSGALRGSSLYVLPETVKDPDDNLRMDGIRLSVKHHAVMRMERVILFRPGGGFVLKNSKMRLLAAHKGNRLGARIVSIQAAMASELEFEAIELDAVGSCHESFNKFQDDRWIGYWLWPRLGFDAPIPDHVKGKHPDEFGGYDRVSELMFSDKDMLNWQLYGETLTAARFDLKEGSTSWDLLLRYANTHGIQV